MPILALFVVMLSKISKFTGKLREISKKRSLKPNTVAEIAIISMRIPIYPVPSILFRRECLIKTILVGFLRDNELKVRET
jgi:hypothetical protein